MKYYRLIVKGDDKIGGVLFAPQEWPYPIARDAEEVENWQSLIVELRDGTYRPFHLCVGGANMVSKELKDLFCSFLEPNTSLEFLPVKALSKEYGNRTYYIMHFRKIYDVIDKENCIRFGDSIIKIALDYRKVKGLNIFNTRPIINDVIVSDTVRKTMKKEKLDFCLLFQPIKVTHTAE